MIMHFCCAVDAVSLILRFLLFFKNLIFPEAQRSVSLKISSIIVIISVLGLHPAGI